MKKILFVLAGLVIIFVLFRQFSSPRPTPYTLSPTPSLIPTPTINFVTNDFIGIRMISRKPDRFEMVGPMQKYDPAISKITVGKPYEKETFSITVDAKTVRVVSVTLDMQDKATYEPISFNRLTKMESPNVLIPCAGPTANPCSEAKTVYVVKE